MRKVFLEELPRKEYKGRVCIDWVKSVGHKVCFHYENISGYFIIDEYIKSTNKVHITCNIYGISTTIYTDGLIKCKIANVINIIRGVSKVKKYIKLCKKKNNILSKKQMKYYNFNMKIFKTGYIYLGYKDIHDIREKNNIIKKQKFKYNYFDIVMSYERFYNKYSKFPVNSDYKNKNNKLVPKHHTVKILKEMGLDIDDLFMKISNIDMSESDYEYKKTINLFKEVCKTKNKIVSVNDLQELIGHDLRWIMHKNANINSYQDFYSMLGFKKEQELTKDEVKEIIYHMSSKLNRPLMYNDFRQNETFDSVGISTINKYWGTMNIMKEDLGLEIVQEDMICRHKTNEEMLNDLQKLIDNLGRVPSTKDIDTCKYMNSVQSYYKAFGGINNALISLGYKPNKKCISLDLSNEEIIQIYKDFIEDSQLVPSYGYASQIYILPSTTTVLRRFNCTWNEFIKMLGYEPNDCRYNQTEAKDGTMCNSLSEAVVHNYLLTKNIKNLNKETLYRDILSNELLQEKAGYKRLDWTFEYEGKVYYVEYFGMMGVCDYNKRHDEKISLITQDGKLDNFIGIYPKDLNKLDIVFDFIK